MHFANYPVTGLATKRVAESLKCIYCGNRDNLTREHIIPEGLSGNIVFGDASCKDCAAITGRLEAKLLRNLLLATRTNLTLKTKRPKERPTQLPLKIVEAGVEKIIYLPVPDHPTLLYLIKLGPPGILVGRQRGRADFIGAWTKPIGNITRKLQDAGITQMITEVTDTLVFNRVLAKIAHGFAKAVYKQPFVEFLPSYILRGSEVNYHLIGGELFEMEATDHLHEMGIGRTIVGKKTFIVVRVRLFGNLGAPAYHVVVGETPFSAISA